MIWPGTSLGEFAVVGASAFLAASMQMPLTAIVLMVEFTRAGHDMLVPMLLSTTGSVAAFKLLAKAVDVRLQTTQQRTRSHGQPRIGAVRGEGQS
ncbi:H+/Cl- antiporter ClcA [Paraburkholderia youngii]